VSTFEIECSQHDAAKGFLTRSTVPIFVEERGATRVHGCGTLYRDHRGTFLITADHVARDIVADEGRYLVPAGGEAPRLPLYRLGRGALALSKERDVAAMRLDNPELLKAFAAADFFRVFGAENLEPMPSAIGKFFICGYPAARASHDAATATITCRGTIIEADAYHGPDPKAYGAKAEPGDLFLDWWEDAALGGISGAAIWTVVLSPTGVWSVERAVRMVAVQTEVWDNHWIRGSNVRTALAAIDALQAHPPL
jgi:hypothetical protein